MSVAMTAVQNARKSERRKVERWNERRLWTWKDFQLYSLWKNLVMVEDSSSPTTNVAEEDPFNEDKVR